MWYKKIKLFMLVVWGLLSREIREHVFENGIFYLFSPLITQLAIWHGIYYLMHRSNSFGMNTSLFITASYMPFWIIEKIAMESSLALTQNKDTLAIKHVKIFDVVFAKTIMWGVSSIVIFFLNLLVLIFIIDDSIEVYNWYNLIIVFILSVFIGFGLGLITCVIGAYIKNAFIWILFFTRSIYLISGIFFPLEAVPNDMREMLLWNPVLHLVELSRYAFIPYQISSEIDIYYVCLVTISLLFLGFVVYSSYRNKFLMEIIL